MAKRSVFVGALAAAWLGGGGASALAAEGDVDNGAVVYAKQCSQCHGDEGAADGPAAEFMLPRPRVFKDNASYKFRSTPSGELPLDEDLFNIITRGIPGSSMPDFSFLSEQDRWDVIAFIKTLTEEFSDPDYQESQIAMEELTGDVEPPALDEGSIERGKQLYIDNKCGQCHGDNGRGNGVSFNEQTDDWQNAILPLNLTIPEHYRGGAQPFDLYRTMSTGLNGAPMPAYADSIEPAARWDLVNYIISLQPKPKDKPDETIVAEFAATLPTTADDEAWANATVARFKLMPNLVEPPRLFWPSIEFVNVRALYSAEEVALLIEWDDRSNSTGANVDHNYPDRTTEILRGTDHPDQLAVQFPTARDDKARPFFLFGDKKRSVNLWWWRADLGATNVMIGKGSKAIADSAGVGVDATVTYEDGRYSMVVRRALVTENEKLDTQFAVDAFVPIAFHAWDGERAEVGNRRSLTTWYWLYLKPEPPPEAYWSPPVAWLATFGLLAFIVVRIRRAEKNKSR